MALKSKTISCISSKWSASIFLLKEYVNMEILIVRENFAPDYTEGKLFIDGAYVCDSLEDFDRGLDSSMPEDVISSKKVYSKTAIPTGRYKVIIDWSNKFQKNLIHLLNVKGFDGVRMHSLNEASQSLGCIGTGVKTAPGWISKSRDTYKVVHSKVEEALNRGEAVYITIEKAAQ